VNRPASPSAPDTRGLSRRAPVLVSQHLQKGQRAFVEASSMRRHPRRHRGFAQIDGLPFSRHAINSPASSKSSRKQASNMPGRRSRGRDASTLARHRRPTRGRGARVAIIKINGSSGTRVPRHELTLQIAPQHQHFEALVPSRRVSTVAAGRGSGSRSYFKKLRVLAKCDAIQESGKLEDLTSQGAPWLSPRIKESPVPPRHSEKRK